MRPIQFQKTLLHWFDQHGRKHLPWQQNKTPYRVWISEIMLQQTQVSTVIPYYERFMAAYPNVTALALAHEDEVLHLWAGLGYYSRARNLHRAARMVVEELNGRFPDTLADLQSLPGVGLSTAGAIMSIAYNQPSAILDGNVKRVLARLHAIREPVNEKATERRLWELARNYMPKHRAADYTQAVMDLGATLCTRGKPLCPNCPFQQQCLAYAGDLVALLPRKKATRELPIRTATLLILEHADQVLLCKRPSPGIWGGLWSFPELIGEFDVRAVRAYCQEQWQLIKFEPISLPAFRHTFSHYHLDIHPVRIKIKRKPARTMAVQQQIWYNPQQPQSVGLPKPIQMIIRDLP